MAPSGKRPFVTWLLVMVRHRHRIRQRARSQSNPPVAKDGQGSRIAPNITRSPSVFVREVASTCAAWLKSLSAHLPLIRTVSGRSVQQAAESADVLAPMRRRESALCGRLDFNRLQLDSQRDAGGCCDRCLARIARRVPLFPRIAGSRIGPVLLQSPEWKIPTSRGPRHSPIEDQRVRRRFPFLN
jgi:hypothetical protein